ncbi:hypothetical protein K493DRAFT_331631 [Basidiobolus meristosporus CBS 931.73]|uniref:DNA-directed RNA polymerase III subunit RPC8 n=1 Tax=Basidiobolus meristosporus CBS 931.73 TaxID=1314790 RepID=A0A1Y1XHZ3_9FUNG|nr:hypothetical protein K493DRAFT_331631 [Basidiobolus meristosporus CBS 931.73]|eukprot:ORX85363.1 hypothetical protein K493DRAFT_331631 [Basidiobolus meristosporus CBS 931.73]
MFILSVFKDTVKIVPQNFRKSKNDALADEINKKYANKVVHDVGLCISLHDILEASEGFIHHSDGCSYVKVKFRLIVFRPFIGEVITGKIRSSSSEGVRVSLGFFDDILIPPALLQESTEFDQNEQVWVWRFDGNELFMDIDETIRLRVIDEMFVDATPIPDAKNKLKSNEAAESKPVEPPYSLLCSIQEDGLGLVSWWGG